MQDIVIVGGGVIGLTTAFELAGRGLKVTLLEAQQPGCEASWAGAGILPPGRAGDPAQPLSRLCRAASHLWPELSAELRELTGVDNGYCCCGGICLASEHWSESDLTADFQAWRTSGTQVDWLSSETLTKVEPAVTAVSCGFLLREEAQVRNPRHLKALELGCARRGVDLHNGQPVVEVERAGGRIRAVRTPTARYEAQSFLVAAGAWSESLLAAAGCRVQIVPVRGQIVLLSQSRPSISHIVESGPRYLVPRADGRLLVGSTEEWVGYDKRNTASALRELLEFAIELVPALSSASFERAWSGLRPHVPDGLPYLGRVPDVSNLYVAAGHFRSGLHLSPITSRVMTQLICGECPEVPIDAFGLDR